MLRAQCTNARSVTSVWGFMQSACVCHHVQFVDDVVPYARERSIEFPNRLTSASTYLCDLHPLDLPSTPADRRKSRYWHWRGGNKWRIDRRQGVSRDRVTLKVPITGCNECISSGDKNARKKSSVPHRWQVSLKAQYYYWWLQVFQPRYTKTNQFDSFIFFFFFILLFLNKKKLFWLD